MAIKEIRPETEGDVWPARHYNPSRTVTVGGIEYMLNAGNSDTVNLYSTPWGVAVVARNHSMGYLGVGLLDPEHHEREDESGGRSRATRTILRERSVVFFQSTEPGQIGPKDTLDYADATILRRILEGYEA